MQTTIERSSDPSAFGTEIAPLYSIRWAAVIAGLAVGLGVHLVLLLLGLAAGLAVLGVGERPDGGAVSMAAAVWNSLSLLIAATVGGYIASRSSGLRRTADGVLHAVASWGASMICYVFLVSALTGTTVAGLFGITTAAERATGGGAVVSDLLGSVQRGDRDATARVLRDRLGLSPDQADQAADRALAMSSNPAATANANRPAANAMVTDVAQTASAASAWLSIVILLSLATGVGGGYLGAHGTGKRTIARTHLHRRHVLREHGDQGMPSEG